MHSSEEYRKRLYSGITNETRALKQVPKYALLLQLEAQISVLEKLVFTEKLSR
jgi:hypothetical protein